jgi:hypothetical protein
MSARLSPDGLYYWDGQSWISTMSPDGRHRWNGTSWVPAAGPVYAAPSAVPREPTGWTRPLQVAVIAVYTYQAFAALLTPYFLGNRIADYMRETMARQQATNPGRRPLPPGFVETMAQMGVWIVWIAVIGAFVIAIVAIVGALRRWTWVYFAILVLIGLGLLGLPADLANVVSGRVPAPEFPAWTYAVTLANALVNVALFVWMLIAMVRYGPWAMRRVAPA